MNASCTTSSAMSKSDVSDTADARRACEGAGVVYGCVGMDYQKWPER